MINHISTVENLRERVTEIQLYNQKKKKKKDIRGEVHTQDLCLHSFWIFFYWCMFVYRLSESPCAVLCCLLVEVISQTHLQAFWSLAQVGHVEGRIGI